MSAQGNASLSSRSPSLSNAWARMTAPGFFLDLKIPKDRPDLVPPLFRYAVQTLQHYQALDKAVFLTLYETIFTGCVTKRSAGARPHGHTWKLPTIRKDPSSYS